jgi:hypothetical protein
VLFKVLNLLKANLVGSPALRVIVNCFVVLLSS